MVVCSAKCLWQSEHLESVEINPVDRGQMSCVEMLYGRHEGAIQVPGESIKPVDHFAIWRKGLRRARPILTALATVGKQGTPLVAACLPLPAYSCYSQFSCTFHE